MEADKDKEIERLTKELEEARRLLKDHGSLFVYLGPDRVSVRDLVRMYWDVYRGRQQLWEVLRQRDRELREVCRRLGRGSGPH